MRVAINALFLDPGVSGGTETYLRGLVPELPAAGAEPVIFTTRRGARALRAEGWGDVVALRSDEGQRLRRLAGEQVAVVREARRRGCDLIHSLGNSGPIVSPLPHALSVLDAHAWTTDALGLTSALIYRTMISAAGRRADVLLTISHAMRDEIVEATGFDADRFVVTHLGPGREIVQPADLDAVRRRHGLSGNVVLNVAAKRPHKNQELLLRALPDTATLVLVGPAEAYDSRLRALAEELRIDDRVRFLEGVPDAELEALWHIAGAAAFPTRSEGFGLPVLEAMRRGVPVACSDIPVMREVGGDVPRYFGPDDPSGARLAIEAALRDDGSAGIARASQFTWAACARATMTAYERACTSA